MKILQIIPHLGVGGAETMMCNLSCELKKHKHEITVVVFYNISSFINDRLKKAGIKIICINKKSGFNLKTLKELKKIINETKPDIIHTHLYVLPYVWLVCGRIPIIHTLHTVASKEQSGLGKKICSFIYKHSKKCTPVAISSTVKESFDNEFNYNFNMPIIENGVPVDIIEKKSNYDFEKNIEIIHVGSLIPVKNHNVMIETIKELKTKYSLVRLHLYGGGYLLNEIEDKIHKEKLDSSIIIEGTKSNINEILKNGDVFILPSKYEGFPLSLIEAMAAGLPCVATNVGGVPDIIDNKIDGILVEPGVRYLMEAIERLIKDEALRENIGKNASKKAQKFSSEVMTKRYIEVYTNEKQK